LKIVAFYSFKGGKNFILENHKSEFEEIKKIIAMVDAESCKTKESKEKTMKGRILYLQQMDLKRMMLRLKTFQPHILSEACLRV